MGELQNFRIEFCRCSEGGNVFSNLLENPLWCVFYVYKNTHLEKARYRKVLFHVVQGCGVINRLILVTA